MKNKLVQIETFADKKLSRSYMQGFISERARSSSFATVSSRGIFLQVFNPLPDNKTLD